MFTRTIPASVRTSTYFSSPGWPVMSTCHAGGVAFMRSSSVARR
jgi:hypothetical protein